MPIGEIIGKIKRWFDKVDPLLGSDYNLSIQQLDINKEISFRISRDDSSVSADSNIKIGDEKLISQKSDPVVQRLPYRLPHKVILNETTSPDITHDAEHEEYNSDLNHIKTYAISQKGKENGGFLRITNIDGFSVKTDMALIIPVEKYEKLQRLGITQRNDQSLTAKLIGAVGDYCFRVLKDQIQYGIITDKFYLKKDICNRTFAELKGLREIERSHGRNWGYASRAVADFLFEKTREIFEITEEFSKKRVDKIDELLESLKSSLKLVGTGENIENTAQDIRGDCRNLLKQFENVKEKLKLFQIMDLTDDIEAASEFSEKIKNQDDTRNLVEHFLRKRANRIIDAAKRDNELITIANGDSVYRGVLQSSLANAEKICTNYIFDQVRRIYPDHQGDYSQKNPNGKITVASSFTIGSDQESVRKFLLASCYVLNEEQDIFSMDDSCFQKVSGSLVKKRGFTRLFQRERTDGISANYVFLKTIAATAHSSVWLKIKDAGRSFLIFIVEAIAKIIRGTYVAIGKFLYKFFVVDFWPIHEFRVGKKNPTSDVQDVFPLSEGEELRLSAEDFDRRGFEWQWKFVTQLLIKGERPHLKLDKDQKKLIEVLRNRGAPDQSEYAPFATPEYNLVGYEPDDFFSSIMGGLEAFYNTFDKIHEASPCTAFYCIWLYAFAGLAAVRPEIVTTIFQKMNLSAITKPFIAWHTATAKAMTNEMVTNFISAGFTAWQELYVVLQAVEGQADSVVGDAVKYLKSDYPKALGAVLAAYGFGHFITTSLPSNCVTDYLNKDKGNTPGIEEFLVGLKMGVISYESLASTPGTQSILTNTISFALNAAFLPIRLSISFAINVILFFLNGYLEKTIPFITLPFRDLLYGIKSCFLRLIDFTARVLNLVSRFIKMMFFKTPVEWFLNTLTVLIKLLAWPFYAPKDNALAARIVMAKAAIFEYFDGFNRFFKDAYRSCRNWIARELIKDSFGGTEKENKGKVELLGKMYTGKEFYIPMEKSDQKHHHRNYSTFSDSDNSSTQFYPSDAGTLNETDSRRSSDSSETDFFNQRKIPGLLTPQGNKHPGFQPNT